MKIDESLIILSNTSKTSQNKESNIRRQSLSIPFHTSNNEETSPQKMNYLYFLIQPKIVQLSQGKNSPFEFYIFKLIPTSHLFNYKVDYYIIELEKMRDSNEVGLNIILDYNIEYHRNPLLFEENRELLLCRFREEGG
jgi:hypothetical protein